MKIKLTFKRFPNLVALVFNVLAVPRVRRNKIFDMQCDQMAIFFVQYVANCKNEKLL